MSKGLFVFVFQRERSAYLVAQLEENKTALHKAEKDSKRHKAENIWLRVQLHELRRGEIQKLFMSLQDHQTNIEVVEENVKLSADMKKVISCCC